MLVTLEDLKKLESGLGMSLFLREAQLKVSTLFSLWTNMKMGIQI